MASQHHNLPETIAGAGEAARWRRQIGVPGRNRLRNGGFTVDQRKAGAAYTSATPFPNGPKAPVLDFWIAQGDGADACDVSQELTVVPTGSYAAILLDAETANKKFGLTQIIESRDCIDLRSGRASAQFKARVGGAANIANIRAAIIEWTGTVDDPTATLAAAGDWGASGANPTLAPGWAYISTPVNLAMTTSYQTFLIENVAVGATAANLALFMWVDDTTIAAGSLLYLADSGLQEGPYATRFVQPDFTEELIAAGRRFRKSFPYATAPAQNAGTAGALRTLAGHDPTAARVIWSWRFPFPMRAAGDLEAYNPSAANSQGRDTTGGADLSTTADTASDSEISIQSFDADLDKGDVCMIHVTVESEFQA